MLRPIDTQTIYQQTPLASSKEQAFKNSEAGAEAHFMQSIHKETELKTETVNAADENQKADNDLDKNTGQKAVTLNRKYKKKKSDQEKEGKIQPAGHIDIRI